MSAIAFPVFLYKLEETPLDNEADKAMYLYIRLRVERAAKLRILDV